MFGRRSEVAGLDIGDLTFSDRGLTVTVRISKADQDAVGATVQIKYGTHLETCPVRLAQAWIATLAAREITDGPLLRGIDRHGRLAGTPNYAGRSHTGRISGQALNDIVRDTAVRAELKGAEDYTFHGLRAGGATSASEAGAAPSTVGNHGRWKGLLMVMHYWRTGDAWRNNALDGVGL
jgi:integrase